MPSDINLPLEVEVFSYQNFQETVFEEDISRQIPIIYNSVLELQSLFSHQHKFWKHHDLIYSHLQLAKQERFFEQNFVTTTKRKENRIFFQMASLY